MTEHEAQPTVGREQAHGTPRRRGPQTAASNSAGTTEHGEYGQGKQPGRTRRPSPSW
ncbi:hypothetical protein LV779_32965 [Streptomyces thinghirensis]|nr:hypothetical protein [Streptomyces thinghirensis]